MPEEKLNLIQFATGQVTQSGTRTTEIVRREFLDAGLGSGATNDVPKHLCRHPITPDSARLIDRAKDAPVRQARGAPPRVDDGLHPRGHRDRPEVAALADQIGDDPVLLPLLDGFQREPQRLAASQTASGLKSPASAASSAIRRTAASRRLMVAGA